MRWRWAAVGGLLLAGVVAADDAPGLLVRDGGREEWIDARPLPLPAEVSRHYEGLRHFARGQLLQQQNRLPEAMHAYDLALQLDPNAVELLRACVPVSLKLERTVAALRLMRRALARRPDQPDLWLRYAQELLDLQRYDEVIQTVPRALASADFAATPAFRADLYVAQASAFDALHRPTEAVQGYREVLRILDDRDRYLEDLYSPTVEELPAERARLLERLARAEQRAGRYDAAVDAYRHAAVDDPQHGRLELNLTEVYLAAKRPAEALQQLRIVLKKPPEAAEPFRLYVEAMHQTGGDAEALSELEKFHRDWPDHSALRLVLAENYARLGRHGEAGRLYREILTVEQVPIKAACAGYLRLLVDSGQPQQALEEFQTLCRQPHTAPWARTMTMALLGEPRLLRSLLRSADGVTLRPTVRLLLLRMALQSNLLEEAIDLARRQVAQDPKPTEAYLLWCQALLKQQRFRELAVVCRDALRHDAITQPLTFHLELAKALAMTRQAQPALQALSEAKLLVGANTTDGNKLLCTELHVLHLLGRHDECARRGEALLRTDLARGPWARQVRYILGHALEASAEYDAARKYFGDILSSDPNDDEAAAALAKCLYLQGQQLDTAQTLIRDAIELDYVAQVKRKKSDPIPTPARPNAHYQATLGAILLRAGHKQEAVALLRDLDEAEAVRDPWVQLFKGDACLINLQREAAERCWKQARAYADAFPLLGVDLRPSLQARLRSTTTSAASKGAVSPAVPASLSSPVRP